MGVSVRIEGARGCGFRKAGGMYLVAPAPNAACGKLPLKVEKCSACGGGIKPARGWTWIEPNKLFEPGPCSLGAHPERISPCGTCLAGLAMPGRAGLIWIGESFYPTPEHFLQEARRAGVSRRISAIPRGFELGETVVFLAHRKALIEACECQDGIPVTDTAGALQAAAQCDVCSEIPGRVFKPGVFSVFRPTAIEQVVTKDTTDEEVEALERRGITPVIVIPEQGEMFSPGSDTSPPLH